MSTDKILKGKKILIVDDEPDILDTLVEILYTCRLDTVVSFDEAKASLEDQYYDLAILDIMGVKGFELLKIAYDRNIPALMLTAHSLSEESIKKSAEEGASYFVSKEKMANIETYVKDILKSIMDKKNPWEKMIYRLGAYYDRHFHGPNWRKQEKKYWEDKIKLGA